MKNQKNFKLNLNIKNDLMVHAISHLTFKGMINQNKRLNCKYILVREQKKGFEKVFFFFLLKKCSAISGNLV
jgi:hypothetical protein